MDRKADPQTQLMIDEAILDYVVYTAIKALLENSSPRDNDVSTAAIIHARLPLHMVGSFLPIFQVLHPTHDTPEEIRFRLRLLQFTYVFTTRQRHLPVTPKPENDDKNSASDAAGRKKRHRPVPLRETLPLFLALSAAQNALHQGSTITELWMRLAAGYMAQAYAEHVLSYQVNLTFPIEEAFRWGFDPDCGAEEGSDEWLINDMFDADKDVIGQWEEIKEEHVRALHPPDEIPLETHLKAMVSDGLSSSTFREKISEFLAGLLSAHPPPLLTQLETGDVDGLSPKATAGLKKRAGCV